METTINNIRVLRNKTGLEISDMLLKLEQESGLEISDIHVVRQPLHDKLGKETGYRYIVDITMRL